MKRIWSLFRYFLLGIITFTILLLVVKANNILQISPLVLTVFRVLSVTLLIIYALRKKTLTTWILVCMVAGAEFGHDVPSVAKEMKVFSDIFLRLIKTIIAPLLFSTLVVGIAGHSDIRQIGRMGWKSLLYFEIVSKPATIAFAENYAENDNLKYLPFKYGLCYIFGENMKYKVTCSLRLYS